MADKLPVNEQRLAQATKRAVQAAGGLADCESETGLSDSQISRCCSPHQRDSITIRDAVRIDAIGHGEQGHPHILNAMAGILGAVVIMLPEPVTDDRCLQMGVIEMSSEMGDVSRAIADALSSGSAGGTEVTKVEAAAALEHVADMERATARMRHSLERIARGDTPAT
ncbi:hypothetical protein KZ810_13150 [Sphingomonas sp. RHCKR47]|uniref:phage regulatory CII family protein n=1 Tax=Sphingomonas citricola TaxID=2862498 RepID=UPI001CA4BCEB|nr:phage regulatory CII family protein [Sphingomonas citricola]MBW6524449.1 hypothetical protein [Sphingomonas citricola]